MKYFTSRLMLAILCICSLSSIRTYSQSTLNADELKTQLVAEWQRAKAYTQEYLTTMPANKYTYKPVDSIRSFAQQMLHLAQATTFFIGNGTGMSKMLGGMDLESRASAQSKDSVSYYVNTSYDFAIDAIGKMDASKFSEKVKFRDFEISRLMWLLKGFEHQTHHRGQTTIYIRLQGIRPPNERLF